MNISFTFYYFINFIHLSNPKGSLHLCHSIIISHMNMSFHSEVFALLSEKSRHISISSIFGKNKSSLTASRNSFIFKEAEGSEGSESAAFITFIFRTKRLG